MVGRKHQGTGNILDAWEVMRHDARETFRDQASAQGNQVALSSLHDANASLP